MEKIRQEMNTGDSNFITPFWKHSFTSRDSSKEAYIVAVTFSGDVVGPEMSYTPLAKKQ